MHLPAGAAQASRAVRPSSRAEPLTTGDTLPLPAQAIGVAPLTGAAQAGRALPSPALDTSDALPPPAQQG